MGTMAQYFEEQGRQQVAMKIARQLIASDVDLDILPALQGEDPCCVQTGA
jgi:hypothetical protein